MLMVKLRTDYITRVMAEDLDKLTDDDRLYVEDKYGHFWFNERMQIQNDDDSIRFIYDDMVYVFDFDSVKMYRVREKPQSQILMRTEEISGFENFMCGILFGVVLIIILSCIGG